VAIAKFDIVECRTNFHLVENRSVSRANISRVVLPIGLGDRLVVTRAHDIIVTI